MIICNNCGGQHPDYIPCSPKSINHPDLEKFQVVCPFCAAIFDLDETVIKKEWDDNKAEEYLKIKCPECEGIKIFDMLYDWEIK